MALLSSDLLILTSHLALANNISHTHLPYRLKYVTEVFSPLNHITKYTFGGVLVGIIKEQIKKKRGRMIET